MCVDGGALCVTLSGDSGSHCSDLFTFPATVFAWTHSLFNYVNIIILPFAY